MAKAIIAKTGALSIAEHEAIVSQVKREAAQAHAEMLDVMGLVSKCKLFIFFCFMLSCARYFFLFFSFLSFSIQILEGVVVLLSMKIQCLKI